MSRAAVRVLLFLAAGAAAALTAGARDAHLDPSLLPAGCPTCHRGHGSSGSPMLGNGVAQVCLRCHESQANADRERSAGELSAEARPPLIGAELAEAYRHRIDDGALSAYEPGIVTCTSCHSPHRRNHQVDVARGEPKQSPRDPRRREHELCDSCHGERAEVAAPGAVGAKLDPRNGSFHPVRSAASERSPSVQAELSGKLINCTDCHGSGSGLHGSSVRGLLTKNYSASDGAGAPATSYQLCWDCHDATVVLKNKQSNFPLHALHVEEQGTSCATCHDSHGSMGNRALIRFGEGDPAPGVTPSLRANRLAFVSDTPGSGICYLTCHGVDHAPESYGHSATPAAKSAESTSRSVRRPVPGGAGQRPSRDGVPARPREPRIRDPFGTGDVP